MNEEPNQFPQPNPVELIEVTITSDLRKAGITVQRIGVDISSKNFTVTTDKEVPEGNKSSNREYAKYYDFTIKFLTV